MSYREAGFAVLWYLIGGARLECVDGVLELSATIEMIVSYLSSGQCEGCAGRGVYTLFPNGTDTEKAVYPFCAVFTYCAGK